ncbi:MAG TPA: hypothetical protein VH044_17955 [Polyangiaceae bacterium]|jgi:hypothetical protein|nr:hypothetical protein [Polyangiaceae bacterium]
MAKPKKPTKQTDEQIAEAAVDALRAHASVGNGELAWFHLSDDKSRIAVGTTHGAVAVFGVFGVTNTGEIGAPQPFNLHNLRMTWRGVEGHPSKEDTEADEAAHNAWLETNG